MTQCQSAVDSIQRCVRPLIKRKNESVSYFCHLVPNAATRGWPNVVLLGEVHGPGVSTAFARCIQLLDRMAPSVVLLVEMPPRQGEVDVQALLDDRIAEGEAQRRNHREAPNAQSNLQMVQLFALNANPSSRIKAVAVDVRGDEFKFPFLHEAYHDRLALGNLQNILDLVPRMLHPSGCRAMPRVCRRLLDNCARLRTDIVKAQSQSGGRPVAELVQLVWRCGSMAVDVEIMRAIRGARDFDVIVFFGGENHCTAVARMLGRGEMANVRFRVRTKLHKT